MKLSQIKFVIFFLFLIVHISFSQSETVYKGKILCNNFPIQKIEIINLNSEKSTFSNSAGEFSIVAKSEDIVVFASILYDYKKISVQPENLNNHIQIISLIKKPEELKEVIITKIKWQHIGSDKNASNQIALDKMQSQIKNPFIYDGSITNGLDFIKIGGLIIDLFKKDKTEIKNKIPEIQFYELAKNKNYQEYYSKSLNLKPDEIELFLQFCGADPKSKIVAQKNNSLVMMDFLFAKNLEFKKLKP
ncbi:hypothetical protein [Flavobacterium sp.]|uniref:hypothetical protein n=1 Tax=Flavobacterium sp. TaxID=239 RepID=UPI0038FC6FAD